MDVKKAKRDYYKQRDAAKRRGIQWLFTFEQWRYWWRAQLGPDWQVRRGQGRHKYCMARNGDKGPYSPLNVKAITLAENASEMRKNGTSSAGEKHGCAKLSERQAIAVRAAAGTLTEISQRFSIHRDTVRYIKYGTLWSHLDTPIVWFTRGKRGPTLKRQPPPNQSA